MASVTSIRAMWRKSGSLAGAKIPSCWSVSWLQECARWTLESFGEAVDEKYALVTGGSSRIGATICQTFASAGYQVISLARRTAEAKSRFIRSMQVDLMDPVATREAAASAARQTPITTGAHNAGAIREKPLEEVSLEDLQALTNLHLAAALVLVQANLATMKQRQSAELCWCRRARRSVLRNEPCTPRPRRACSAWRERGHWGWAHRYYRQRGGTGAGRSN
jgi:NAD(P)-dependent dehydrogenase (short-subunit alcohol dehydrogenase family)